MPKKRSTQSAKSKTNAQPEPTPANAKLCDECATINSFKRVKCEKCGSLLPEGKFERSKRLRQQALRRQQQNATSTSLFSDAPGFAGAFAFTEEGDTAGPTKDNSNIEEVLSGKNKDAEEASKDGGNQDPLDAAAQASSEDEDAEGAEDDDLDDDDE